MIANEKLLQQTKDEGHEVLIRQIAQDRAYRAHLKATALVLQTGQGDYIRSFTPDMRPVPWWLICGVMVLAAGVACVLVLIVRSA